MTRCVVSKDETYLRIETTLPDGAVCHAIPDFARDQEMAASVGLSVLDLWRSHDPSHHLLSRLLGRPFSPTLWAVAHGTVEQMPDAVGWEEELVLAFQKLLGTGEKTPPLRVLSWHGYDLETVRKLGIELLGSTR